MVDRHQALLRRKRTWFSAAGLDVPEMGMPGYPEFVKAISPDEVPAAQVAEAKEAIPALVAATVSR